MGKISKFTQLIFILIGVIWAIFSSFAFAQEGGGSLPPPVEIEFGMEGIPRVGEEVTLKLKVTPQQDMHADISCLLPEGIEPVRKRGLILRPHKDLWPNIQRQESYTRALVLWVGPLKKETPKEFSFAVINSDRKNHELIAHIQALAKWGVKEEILAIE